MANRAGGEGKPAVPKEVFELDKDERWQARLDEARARREVALREKAAGKSQKPRPKPWEIEGSGVEEPPVIDPVVQERGDDKFDFADRLETIREAKAERAAPPKPTAPPIARVREPEPPVEPVAPVAKKPAAPEPRARPQPSLVLPGAPDVADLAARYAETLDRPEPFTTREPTRPLEEPAPQPTAELVSLPTAADPVDAATAPAPLTRAERRRGIRPLGMAIALLGLAAMPLTTEAPELETGPAMPLVSTFRIQPALGVTWALAEPPVLTRSSAWQPRPGPGGLSGVPFEPPASVLSQIAPLPLAGPGLSGALIWSDVATVPRQTPPAVDLPVMGLGPAPAITEAPAPPVLPVDSVSEDGAVTPVETRAPARAEGAPALPVEVVPAPPRPAPVDGNATLPAPPPPPAARPLPSDTVVEADPLRVTILAPSRVDRALTDDIATSIQNDGHELVRVKDVTFNISNRNLRFFHEEDRAAAARMAERYDAELRDFTWFRPQPLEGTAELWLAGRTPSGNTSGRTQPSARSDLLERALERLGLGTELPDALLPRRGN